ncbi:MAG: MEKHLA domain-containing protein [Nitrospira sp.]|jgi:hypothetical protein|nr:MEKHLA domain-containing protein [Nitrospira sp.]
MSSMLWTQPETIAWSHCLLDSFHRWTGRELLPRAGSPGEQARALFSAPCVVVSHGTEADPILNYGNQAALDLWEMTWEQLTRTPSRLTAEPMNREERARMLAVAAAEGYFTGYRGVRISATGKRFLVEDATVWNVVDGSGVLVGQAATFVRWTPIG